MSNSSLATEKYPAHKDNYTDGRSKKITEICIHHMAGVLTAKQCGAIFQRKGRNGSSNYGIGKNGEIAVYVNESDTAWCNSNWDSNCRSVSIETSNSKNGGDWLVSDKVLNSLIKLVADIAKRNNMGKLVKGKNVTWHSMYAATNCPGKYLLSKMDYIVSEANKINGIGVSSAKPTATTSSKKGTLTVNSGSWNVRKGAGTNYAVVKVVKGGTKLDYYGTSNGWYKVDGGYISPKAVKLNSTSTTKTTSSKPKVTYLANKKYKGSSLVDALKQIKVDSSFAYRKKLASKNGVKLYVGSASQNTKLLNLLKQGKLIKA